jgi:hypothetical protein
MTRRRTVTRFAEMALIWASMLAMMATVLTKTDALPIVE